MVLDARGITQIAPFKLILDATKYITLTGSALQLLSHRDNIYNENKQGVASNERPTNNI